MDEPSLRRIESLFGATCAVIIVLIVSYLGWRVTRVTELIDRIEGHLSKQDGEDVEIRHHQSIILENQTRIIDQLGRMKP